MNKQDLDLLCTVQALQRMVELVHQNIREATETLEFLKTELTRIEEKLNV